MTLCSHRLLLKLVFEIIPSVLKVFNTPDTLTLGVLELMVLVLGLLTPLHLFQVSHR